MSRRLSATESLARDICWGGFSNPKTATKLSKSAYWAKIDRGAKLKYMEHAAEMIWWTRRLGAARLAKAVERHDACS